MACDTLINYLLTYLLILRYNLRAILHSLLNHGLDSLTELML